MEIQSSRLGVPFVLDDGEVVPLTHPFIADLACLEVANPGLLDDLRRRLRQAAEEIAGIDADLPDVEWWAVFNGVLTLHELSTPLSVVAEADMSASRMREGMNV